MYPLVRYTSTPESRAKSLRATYREPLEPTSTMPGTEARIRVYEQRFEAGEQVFHPGDTKLWDHEE